MQNCIRWLSSWIIAIRRPPIGHRNIGLIRSASRARIHSFIRRHMYRSICPDGARRRHKDISAGQAMHAAFHKETIIAIVKKKKGSLLLQPT
jgi:hypothetical protein